MSEKPTYAELLEKVKTLEKKVKKSKKIEEALRESEEKYRSTMESSLVGIYLIQDLIFKFVNSKMASYHGYEPHEMEGKLGPIDLLLPEQREKVAKNLNERAKGVPGQPYEVECFRRDGSVFSALVFGKGITYKGKRASVGTMIDITELKSIKKALKKSEEKYKNIVENAVVGIFQINMKGKILLTNDSFVKIFGYESREELKASIQFITQLALYETSLEQILMGREIEFKRKNGESIWCNVSVRKTKISDGESLYEGFIKDITKRKKAEAALHQTRNFLSNIINSMPSMLIGINTEGHVTHWNNEVEKRTGIISKKAEGRNLFDVLPELKDVADHIKRTIHKRVPYTKTNVPQENGTRFSDITIYPLISNGVDGTVIRIDDVTEKICLEEMVVQSEKMMALGGLTAGMAHEINNPLAGILQNIQVIGNRFSRNLPKNREIAKACGTSIETIRQYLEEREVLSMMEAVMDSGHRAAKIVKNMLSFCRKTESSFSPYNLVDLLEKSIELAENDYDLKKKYDFRHMKIIREYEDDLPRIVCEGGKIEQVFLNILTNGAQAMAEKRTKTDESSHFILRIFKEEENIRVEFEDNGPGMDKNTQKRVFEPFFTTKKKGTGTGLGLSVAHFIITKNHGGTLSVDSTPGKGSKFSVQLPVNSIKQEMYTT